ncbi:MAG: hypothetical protein RL748_343 [Pseudomonadota bacterium]
MLEPTQTTNQTDNQTGNQAMQQLKTAAQIIKHQEVVPNHWSVLRLEEGDDVTLIEVPAGSVIVPLAVWQAQRSRLQSRAQLGVWLPSNAQAADVADDLAHFAVIAIDFPKFSDGRGFSIAYNLRRRLHYPLEIRAIGDVLRDQLFYMKRVGFDAFEVRADKDIHDALKGLTVFSETYQDSLDQKSPLFRRAERGQASAVAAATEGAV